MTGVAGGRNEARCSSRNPQAWTSSSWAGARRLSLAGERGCLPERFSGLCAKR